MNLYVSFNSLERQVIERILKTLCKISEDNGLDRILHILTKIADENSDKELLLYNSDIYIYIYIYILNRIFMELDLT